MLKNIYAIPALILHELSHILLSIILGGRLKKVEVKDFKVRLEITNLKNMDQVRFVAMAPLLVPLLLISLSFLDSNFIYGFIYSVSVFRTTLPSTTDFKTSKFKVPFFLNKKKQKEQ